LIAGAHRQVVRQWPRANFSIIFNVQAAFRGAARAVARMLKIGRILAGSERNGRSCRLMSAPENPQSGINATPGAALVTGAADRVGAVLAARLAAAGYPLLVHYNKSRTKAEAVVAGIRGRGGRAAAVQADLTDRHQRAGLIAAAAAPFGPLTVLVNSASLFERDSAFDVDAARWDAHFAIHAEAPVFLARDFAAQLPAAAEGNIINVIDERVLHLSPAYFSYTLSKATLWTATQTLAQSFAPRIRVNAIGNGPTLPERGRSAAAFAAAAEHAPLKRNTTPDEIASAVLFLLNAPAITGQMLALDGGRHIEWPVRSGPTSAR
jgi:NAD(P)-dependent dehydrogenase (short-subunit alcohol dehydrogenase family)